MMNPPELEFDDTLLVYKPWDPVSFNCTKKLRIGYVKSVNIFPACAAQQRAIDESVEIGMKLGHEMIELDYDFDRFFFAFLEVIGHGDKAAELKSILKGEKHIKEYNLFFYRKLIPLPLLKIIGIKKQAKKIL